MDERLLKIEELFKNKAILNKRTMKWEFRDNQELREFVVEVLGFIDTYYQSYYNLANFADAFVDLMPQHKLYESCRQDLKGCLKRIKGL